MKAVLAKEATMFAKLWASIQTWFASKGGFAHVVAVAYVAAIGAYGVVPAFTSLVNNVYGAMPSWAHQLILAGLGLYAWYKRTSSPAGAVANVKQDKVDGSSKS